MGKALGHPRPCRKAVIRSSSAEPSRLSTWQKLRVLDIGKIFEALGYGAEIDSLEVLLGLSLANLRSEPLAQAARAFLSSLSSEARRDPMRSSGERTLCTS